MLAGKTAELLSCACRLGALAGGASSSAEDAFAAYGLELGLAFQEQDDLLGVWAGTLGAVLYAVGFLVVGGSLLSRRDV